MPHVPVAHLLWLLFAGLPCGFRSCSALRHRCAACKLRGGEQIALRQALIRRLRILAPAIFLPSFLLTLLIAFQERHQEGLWFQSVGSLAVGCLLMADFTGVLWQLERSARTSFGGRPESWTIAYERRRRVSGLCSSTSAPLYLGCCATLEACCRLRIDFDLIWFALQILSWWVPYIFGTAKPWQVRYGKGPPRRFSPALAFMLRPMRCTC